MQTILINKKYSNFTEKVIKNLNKKRIHVRPGWELMTNLKHFKYNPKMDLSIATSICKRIINIPSSSFLIKQLKNKK